MREILLFVVFFNFLNAQENYLIRGKVTNFLQTPLEYVEVSLLNTTDSSYLSNTLTNSQGIYSLNAIQGDYIVEYDFFGTIFYKNIKVENQDVFIKDVVFKENNTVGQVIVEGQKKMLSFEGGSITMNVKENPYLEGKNGIEILEVAPKIYIDQNTKAFNIKGSASTILINGRKTYMDNETLYQYIESLPKNQIRSIEIISNPSAKYDAEDKSIINIVLDRSATQGYSGSLSTDFTQGHYPSHKTSANLNAQLTQKLSMSTRLSYNRYKVDQKEHRVEDLLLQDITYDYDQFFKMEGNRWNYDLGFNYKFNSNHNLSLNGTYYNNKNKANQLTDVRVYESIDSLKTYGDYDHKRTFENYTLNFNYTIKMDSIQQLDFIADYVDYGYERNSYYRNTNKTIDGILINDNTSQSLGETDYTVFAAQVDYTSFLKIKNLDLGIKYTNVDNTNRFVFEDYNPTTGIFELNTTNSTDFDYKEQIMAGYASYTLYNFLKSKIDLTTGLRIENTIGEGDFKTGVIQKRDYLDWFPNIILKRAFENKSSLSFSYAKKIQRPSYSSLNPQIHYINEYSTAIGNPYLKPSYTDAYELNYDHNNWNISLFHDYITGTSSELIRIIDDEYTQWQMKNGDKIATFGVSIGYRPKITKWYSINLSSDVYYKDIQAYFEDFDPIDNSKWLYQFKIGNQLNLNPFKIDFSINYFNANIMNYTEMDGYLNSSLNISYKVHQFSFYTKINDLFNTFNMDFITQNQSIDMRINRNVDGRNIAFGLTYNFKKGREAKKINQKSSLDNVKGRY